MSVAPRVFVGAGGAGKKKKPGLFSPEQMTKVATAVAGRFAEARGAKDDIDEPIGANEAASNALAAAQLAAKRRRRKAAGGIGGVRSGTGLQNAVQAGGAATTLIGG